MPQVDRRQRSDRLTLRSDWQPTLAVSLATFLLLSPGLFFGIPGGKAINGGLRILAGEVPYRDFWTMYAPGQFYLVAALFRVFGLHVLVQGTADVLITAAAAGVLFHMLRRRLDASAKSAAAVTGLFVAMEWGTGREISSYEPLLLCAFLAVNFLLRYFDGQGRSNLAWAGACLGVGAWFKHDVAFYLTAGSSAALLLSWMVVGSARPSEWLHPFRAVRVLAGSCAVVVIPVIALLAWKAGPDAWQDLVRFPATDFRIVRGEPYPSLLPPLSALGGWMNEIGSPVKAFVALTQLAVWILANMPQLVFVSAVAWLMRRRRQLAPPQMAAGLLFLSCMPFFWMAAHVQQNTHLSSMAIFSLLIGVLVWTETASYPTGSLPRRLMLAAFSIYALGMVVRPALGAARIPYLWSTSRTTSIPMVRGIRVPESTLHFYEPIVGFVREHVPPDEPIYVGVVRHDAIVISNQAFYYLAERPSVTRYNELHPGLADDPRYQQEMIEAIERRAVRCVVLWRFGWDNAYLDQIRDHRRGHLPHLGTTGLDEYLRREFDVLAEYGEYVLMWRRGIPRPPAPPSAGTPGVLESPDL